MHINRSPEVLYEFWRNFERLPEFMQSLVAVRQTDSRRSHWIAKAPAGTTVEWDAEIINEIPNQLIGWKTLNGSDVISAGSVHFEREQRSGGTRVRVRMQYEPPAGRIGAAVAWMLGRDPSRSIADDLNRFKQLMETTA